MIQTKQIVLFILLLFFSFPKNLQAQFWSSEAEDGSISGTTEIIKGCEYASGGEFVKLNNSNENSLLFENVQIVEAGTYRLQIDYFYVGTPYLEIFVNDQSVGVKTFATALWCYQAPSAQFKTDIDLNSGINKIEFRVANGNNTPLIDKLEIYDPSKVRLSIDVSNSKIIPGQDTELTVWSSDNVADDVLVNFNVTGVDASAYQITPASITIAAGTNSASAVFQAIDNSNTSNLTATINPSTTHDNTIIGDPGFVEIDIVAEKINYYLSSSKGDDSNDGKSESTPWKTLEKVNNTNLNPGDSVLFKTGDTFIGQLVVSGSGAEGKPLVFSSYGNGEKPIIDGAKEEGGAHLTAVLINNQEYIEIEKLEITNERIVSRTGVVDNLAYGLYVLNNSDKTMHHIIFKHLTIRDVFALSTDDLEFNSIKVAAIGYKSEGNSVAGKEKNIRDVLVDSCYITRSGRYGIHSGHGGGAEGIGNDSINRNMNFVFTNNTFYQTGGSCITPGRTYNCLIENNIFDYPGSDADPRMVNRGSGAWFWNCQNLIAQYNKSYHVRGYGDSYGMHIDFGNRDVILQYNYSEDSEGGFVEILGKNINSTYRFNVSVNDGFRDFHGNSIWVSDFAGTNSRIASDSNYVYNNTIYVDADITPDILIVGKNTFVYNNIFYATGSGKIGEEVTVDIEDGSQFFMSNNLFYGNVSNTFVDYDQSPVNGKPLFEDAGALNVDGYILQNESNAFVKGKVFPEPKFPMAGIGIFRDVKVLPETDLYGNPVSVSTTAPNIGAYNGEQIIDTGIDDLKSAEENTFKIYPNPVKSMLNVSLNAKKTGKIKMNITDLLGRLLQTDYYNIFKGENTIQIPINQRLRNGIYLITIEEGRYYSGKRFILVR